MHLDYHDRTVHGLDAATRIMSSEAPLSGYRLLLVLRTTLSSVPLDRRLLIRISFKTMAAWRACGDEARRSVGWQTGQSRPCVRHPAGARKLRGDL